MKFPYVKEPLTDIKGNLIGVTYRPLIPVAIRNNDKVVDYLPLIDSGADYNIFPAALADAVDLTFAEEEIRHFVGLGGARIRAYGTKVELEIGGVKFQAMAYFSPDLPKNGRAVLGQVGFFDKFRVKFEYDRKLIEVTPI